MLQKSDAVSAAFESKLGFSLLLFLFSYRGVGCGPQLAMHMEKLRSEEHGTGLCAA